tara:strand:+ start:261 stop:431 length:171 start_codon:yes stop_codon:yes gene_type:complete
MKKPIRRKDATDKLYNIFGDDDLFDAIEDAVRDDENQESDIRHVIQFELDKRGIKL